MKKFLAAFILIISFTLSSRAQKNISRLGAFYANGQTLAGCWHYVDSLNREYALIGAVNGIMILDITNPANPVYLFQLPGLNSLWHEIKVSGNYAYAVSEAQDPDTLLDGMQIINLSYLPDSAPNHFWHSDGIMTDKLRQAHSITVDSKYVYVNGHSVPNHGHGVFILDKSDPWNPVYVGAESNRYCHDSYVRGDTLWTSDIQDGMFSVYDVSDRANPVQLATQQTPALFNHNAWLSDNGQYLFTADERSGSPLCSFDVSNLNNITLLDAYYTINMQPAEAHNVRVLNDFIINASYGSQVTIVDAARPENLIEIGNYPTGTGLCWDADPYLPSGVLIATDTWTDSAYFLQPTYIRACYLEGIVTDSITGLTINDAKIDIASVSLHDSTNLIGQYKTGYVDAGLYMVAYSKAGYYTKTLPAQLNNGVLTILDVQLRDSASSGVAGIDKSDLVRVENSPSDNQVTILISQSLFKKAGSLHLIICDAAGKIVFEEKNIAKQRLTILKKDIASGVYFFTLLNGNEISGKGKLIFQ
ncbi:MAG: choice-of-anchor B family protein [Bacteroidota bacterium]